MQTFNDLGIPFPLFEAVIDDAASVYRGQGVCFICHAEAPHCFELSVGADLILPCPQCGTENALDAVDCTDHAQGDADCEEPTCRVCHQRIPFPSIGTVDMIVACYACLRQGKAALTKDTVFGMIRWEDAIRGQTHGAPGLENTGYTTVDVENGWRAAHLDQEWLFELLRTPRYTTWQGERWQFCCGRPMIYVGAWESDDFNAYAPDGNGRMLFDQVVDRANDALWKKQLHDVSGIYVFRCPVCHMLKAHWDMA